jgi:tRNA(Ile)-lysidine synthase
VSGGVDSVVLLDMLSRAGDYEMIVAHFDHGIRDDSAEDARFVEKLAEKYGCVFEMRREELGKTASEELARNRRYAFLRALATQYDARIATAHHMDDIAETIAINITRGTGWRGLAVLASDVYRPLLGRTKAELIAYAEEHGLAWREDSTNSSDAYLRNRLRAKLMDDDMTLQLASLRARQVELRDQIDAAVVALQLQSPYSRYYFMMLSPRVALECLRHITSGQVTRPQLERARLAIATHRNGSRYEVGAGISLDFTSRHFTVQMVKLNEV